MTWHGGSSAKVSGGRPRAADWSSNRLRSTPVSGAELPVRRTGARIPLDLQASKEYSVILLPLPPACRLVFHFQNLLTGRTGVSG